MLVMGSMIGSGSLSCRGDLPQVNSPRCSRAADYRVPDDCRALSYGELAAMMPAGRPGQYVYLREPWVRCGVPLWLDAFPGDSDPERSRRWAWLSASFWCFLSRVSSSHWILILERSADSIGPMTLGNMDVGLSTQNWCNRRGGAPVDREHLRVKTGHDQNIFTAAKVSALAGSSCLDCCRRTRGAGGDQRTLLQNRDWACCTRCMGVGGPTLLVGTLTILAVAQVGSLFSRRCLEQRDFHGWKVKKSQPEPAAVARYGNRGRDPAVHPVQRDLPECAAARWQPGGRDHSGTRYQ